MKAVFVELPGFARYRTDEFWLFTIYDKKDMNDLSEDQRRQFVEVLHHEIQTRQNH